MNKKITVSKKSYEPEVLMKQIAIALAILALSFPSSAESPSVLQGKIDDIFSSAIELKPNVPVVPSFVVAAQDQGPKTAFDGGGKPNELKGYWLGMCSGGTDNNWTEMIAFAGLPAKVYIRPVETNRNGRLSVEDLRAFEMQMDAGSGALASPDEKEYTYVRTTDNRYLFSRLK